MSAHGAECAPCAENREDNQSESRKWWVTIGIVPRHPQIKLAFTTEMVHGVQDIQLRACRYFFFAFSTSKQWLGNTWLISLRKPIMAVEGCISSRHWKKKRSLWKHVILFPRQSAVEFLGTQLIDLCSKLYMRLRVKWRLTFRLTSILTELLLVRHTDASGLAWRARPTGGVRVHIRI